MIARIPILALASGDSILGEQGGLVELAGIVAPILAAAYLVSLAVRAGGTPAALGTWVAGLALAAALGFAGWNADGVPLLLSMYLLLGSAGMLYFLPRESELVLWVAGSGVGGALLYVFAGPMGATFVLVATLAIFGGLKVLQAEELVHATIWLAVVLVSVAGAYISLGAPFLATIQILVYVGAVITLILFTSMLTVPSDEAHFLDKLELPPGVTIESAEEIHAVLPARGQGPMKALDHPRRPTRTPETLYGVSIADGVFGSDVPDWKGKKGAS